MKDIKIELNIKSIMMFESLTGHSFYNMREDDMIDLLYACVVCNNPMKITKKEFEDILINKKIFQKLMKSVRDEMSFIESISPREEEEEKVDGEKTASNEITVTDVATSLIVSSGLDMKYVLEEMRLWELAPFAKAVENKTKQEMTGKRFWTYLSMLPHIDGKKVGGPEKLLPFPWEQEDKKNNMEKFMNENTDKILDFFNKANKEDERIEDKSEEVGSDDSREGTQPTGNC